GLRSEFGLYGAITGALLAGAVVVAEKMSARVSLRGLSAAVFGLLLALITANLLSAAIETIGLDPLWESSLKLVLVLVLAYLGVVFSLRGRDEFSVVIPYVKFQRQDQPELPVILDTSAIVDGRVADVVQTRFLEGYFVVPRFVLKELQDIADSSDSLKRNRGRRGLDVLHKLKKDPKFNFRISSEDFSEIPEVDQKIIKLARLLDARVMTTDFNLNRVAEFHGVTVLNINELSNALKPIVLPGEAMEVRPVKEGKEHDQAVAYLNDGTMVVVEGGKPFIEKTLNVRVTSVLQTPAGRMIFTKIDPTAG
ncbi:MAG: TRAM domain-containing protein, partial [Candidatus Omnitrophica bacterium]|nr:TRAM domain-containing protein [Candidatus Omnitrophota bacterium]